MMQRTSIRRVGVSMRETMRIVYSLLWVLLLAVAGCSRLQDCHSVLAAADSMMEVRPDSAYALLSQVADEAGKGDEGTRAYFTLLYTQASYKLYKPVPSDIVIRQAVNYYERLGNKSLLCRAYYYRAMTLYERNCHEQALVLLRKGEQLAAELHDVLQLSKYHESLCMVNNNARCNELMLKYAKLSLDDALQLQDTAAVTRAYQYISVAYYRIKKHEKERSYLKQSIPLLQSVRGDESKASILVHLAHLYYRDGDMLTAKKYLDASLDITAFPYTYAFMGRIYSEMGDTLSADSCWKISLNSDNPRVVINTLTYMKEYYKKCKDYKSLSVVTERIYHMQDSLQSMSEKHKIAKLQYQYDVQLIESKYYKFLSWTFASSSVVLLFIILFIIYHRYTVKTYVNQIIIKDKSIQDAQKQIEVLESSGEEHGDEIRRLQGQIAKIRRQTNERLGRGKELYDKILMGGRITPMDNEQYLIEYYSIVNYRSYNRLMNEYKRLTTRQLTYLLLCDMGKTDEEIRQTLQITQGNLRTIKSRLKSCRNLPYDKT